MLPRSLGDEDGAIGHFRDMLGLNPNDNQGIRDLLAACLLRRGEDVHGGEKVGHWSGGVMPLRAE